jgi:hypothetical protein
MLRFDTKHRWHRPGPTEVVVRAFGRKLTCGRHLSGLGLPTPSEKESRHEPYSESFRSPRNRFPHVATDARGTAAHRRTACHTTRLS